MPGYGWENRGQSFFLAFPFSKPQRKIAMARKVRVEFESAIYHVTCRGDRRENIFEDDADRARFLETLAQACQRTGWKIHAYVLMSNHYHWLLETPQRGKKGSELSIDRNLEELGHEAKLDWKSRP